MSYEKVIGFGVNPDKPKAEPVNGRPHDSELFMFKKMGVEPFFISLKEWMPESNREPEQKIFLPNAQSFNLARELISEARNAFMIPAQNYEEKNPLTSILLDTSAGVLDQGNYTLRYRFEMQPDTGVFTQGDWNEKSGMKGGNVIGGCVNRHERENVQYPNETLEESYQVFIEKYRRKEDPTYCDKVRFEQLYVGAAYQCARNEIGVALKHPLHDVMFVFEVCEDFWNDSDSSMLPNGKDENAKYHEWEFEMKQVWGILPPHIQSKEAFQLFALEAMTMFRDYMHYNLPGSTINLKSKAEIAKENIEEQHRLDDSKLASKGLKSVFAYAVEHGGKKTLEQTMVDAHQIMHEQGKKLHNEKIAFNKTAKQPDILAIGYGSTTIPYINDNFRPASKPVAGGQEPVAVIA